ncbi:MAG: dienelactone hydrolase family protein [Desulfobacterales bacterium]|jgi:dienelactone hydrolase
MKKLFIAIYILLIATAVNAEVVSQNVEYKHEDIVLEGYLAYDDTAKGKRPGVLVVHEWWGLNDYVRMRVDKLAKLGYVAFALDMYGKGIWTDQASKAQELSGHLRGKPIMRQRARAGLEILRKNERVDPTKIAAIGYCFGGTTVLELAYSGADIAGVVSFHGGLTTPKAEDMSRIKAKILVLHGANDAFIPPEKIAAFQEGVGKAGADWQMIYYGGAVHSFTNPAADKKNINGLAYSPSADDRSWKHMQLFFDEII